MMKMWNSTNLPVPVGRLLRLRVAQMDGPSFAKNKYSGKVLVHKKMIQFPEKNVRPFEWGSKKGRCGRNHR